MNLFSRNKRGTSNKSNPNTNPSITDSTTISRTSSHRSNSSSSSNSTALTNDVSSCKNEQAKMTMASFKVKIPPNVKPGESFQVYVHSRLVKMTCPPNARPGQFLQIKVQVPVSQNDKEPSGPTSMSPRRNTSTSTTNCNDASTSPNVTPIANSHPQAYLVSIPRQVSPGQSFPILINGQSLMVTAPPNARPGFVVRIVPPTSVTNRSPQAANNTHSTNTITSKTKSSNKNSTQHQQSKSINSQTLMTPFQVLVPQGVDPGQPFIVQVQGKRLMIKCPTDALPGQKIRFQLPKSFFSSSNTTSDTTTSPLITDDALSLSTQKLEYDQDSWARTLNLSTLKFKWIPIHQKSIDANNQSLSSSFSSSLPSLIHDHAFVRQLTHHSSSYYHDPHSEQGEQNSTPFFQNATLSIVSPLHASSPSTLLHPKTQSIIVSFSEIIPVQQSQSFATKINWFRSKISFYQQQYNYKASSSSSSSNMRKSHHIRIQVNRSNLLSDSIETIMNFNPHDLTCKSWRFEFIGEEGIDAGGLKREWFHLISCELFDLDRGLFQSKAARKIFHKQHDSSGSSSDGSSEKSLFLQINPCSDLSNDDNHLIYFRFLGRILGKALIDGELITGHLVPYLYKQILAWPITFTDLELLDSTYYQSLIALFDMNEEDLESLCLDFTAIENKLSGDGHDLIEIIPGGRDINVTKENLQQYVQAIMEYRLVWRVKDQLKELLLGFYDVVPEPLLAIFDYQDLELALCGLPKIDVKDWKRHTIYSGLYHSSDENNMHTVCEWFWDVVENDFDQEMRARLLQFVTGTSGVPSRGFCALQGNDGDIRKFNIHGMEKRGRKMFPRAHTCFNRLDLPTYETKHALYENLKIAITMVATGFDLE